MHDSGHSCKCIMSGIFRCRYPVPMVWQMTILYVAIGIVLPAAVIAICIVGLVHKCGTTFIVISSHSAAK